MLLAIGLVAFSLRVYRLNYHNIWGDEAVSIWLSKMLLPQVVAGGADTHPPLYPLLLHWWLRLAGDSSFAVRFLSVIPGILSVSGVYALGRRLSGHRIGMLTAGLAAISPFAVYYSQETRMYAWVAFFSMLSVYSFLRLLQQSAPSNSVRFGRVHVWYLVFFAGTLAAIYTHYYAFLVLMAQNLFALWRWRKGRLRLLTWLAVQAGLAIAYVPWVLAQFQFLEGKAGSRFYAWGPVGMYNVWVRSLKAFGAGTTVPSPVGWMALGLSGFVAIGLVFAVRRQAPPGIAEDNEHPFLATYLLVPLFIAWLLGPLLPFFWERYLIVILPAYQLLLTIGLLTAVRHRLMQAGVLAFIVALSFFSLGNYYFNPAYIRSGYRDLMAYVEEHAQPGDSLLLANLQQEALFAYYGTEQMPPYWFANSWYPQFQTDLQTITEGHDRLWLVMFGNPAEYDPAFVLENWLSQNAFRAYHGDYVDAGLSLYVVSNTEPNQSIEANFQNLISLTAYGLSSQNRFARRYTGASIGLANAGRYTARLHHLHAPH